VSLRLVSYNIQHGGRGRERAIARVISALEPDVVLLQEASAPQAVEAIARAAAMPEWGSRAGQSLGFLSRLPITYASWTKPRVSRHAFIEIQPGGTAWRLFGVHLSAVHAAWTEQRRRYEMRALLTAIRAHQHGPHALAGDFNTLAPGEWLDVWKLPARLRALVWMSGGAIRWRTIQAILDAGYVDAFRYQQPDVIGHTFPTWDPHVRLDYLFVPAPFVGGVTTCRVAVSDEARDASDHYPLFSELSVPAAARIDNTQIAV
jgi:endonuclease/exonuclease/phosphatase family metal-dependent hydrolase